MQETRARFRTSPPLSQGQRLAAALAALLALLAAFGFYHASSTGTPAGSSGAKNGATSSPDRPPFVRFLLGGGLWCLFDASLQGDAGRTFPQFSVTFAESRSAVEIPLRPPPHELLVLFPAERFLSDELVRRQKTSSDLTVEEGPEICQTHLALVMSSKTHADLMSSSPPPSTLLDWLRACESTGQRPKPVRFMMADPATSSSSWLALAELLSESVPAKSDDLTARPAGELGAAISDLRRHIVIAGNSDRLAMYRFLLNGCPDDEVLLVYSHLPELASIGGAFPDCTIVVPPARFQPMVRPVFLASRDSSISIGSYSTPLLAEFTRVLLPDMRLPAPPPSGTPGTAAPVPDYATMTRLLDLWNEAAPPK